MGTLNHVAKFVSGYVRSSLVRITGKPLNLPQRTPGWIVDNPEIGQRRGSQNSELVCCRLFGAPLEAWWVIVSLLVFGEVL